ncbi:Response regulator receiver domain-containing protein [Rhizobium sp. NFR07]|jgi:two-component system, response regulator PdtaR|uniref:response regulator n=1 Tax=Rhizobium sp. NFR07 TaxID=1566262 RepID=UPI0008E06882|nr:response regulator [Rhizobium sp. NFR07]SFB64409.1 Response regulator receiver domain-containing protein [Rhizobium sp. NFR07]
MHSDTATVLVVEDDALVRLGIVDELELSGFRVLEAESADQAISVIEQYPEVRLIFTDIDMPGTMDGLKLAAFVRDRWPPIKIIVTSGRVTPDPSSLPEDIPFFTKPYEFDHVVTAIRVAVTGR